MIKKELVALILAGGQGTRLKDLTKNNAKPAVPFGGKYRIIDFTLSNCAHSGIDTVGILTQYQPLTLNNHIGIGTPWDLDRRNGGVTILSPHANESGVSWYKGTADSVYQNMSFIEYYDPEYILVLSGDHIYKMDYSKMLKYHKEKGADATIAVIEVPLEEASRFGIMNTKEDDSIYEFEEKPKNPKSNLASMGIYIFNWKKIKVFLEEDNKNSDSSNDFGKNIIPYMVGEGAKLYAYRFKGYWKDVGTIESYWQASMDLLNENNELNLYEKHWKIYSQNFAKTPQYIGYNAKVQNSMISDGCTVNGEVINSILFPGVYLGEKSKVVNSVVLPGVFIEDGVVVDKAIVGSNTFIGKNNVIKDSEEIVLIGEGTKID
ncbi:glucose-1-phosphate adenylyltransferase [Clostridium rectalis]|uniref:glucose-1-phosphate adenylyltransferase n=1 Tax=Clostridium rectalis TaxID=2040295 RepID=UPI000F63BD18|nr:glucose-1-phosphate adenylyltransferase [Clostridium rectalis]